MRETTTMAPSLCQTGDKLSHSDTLIAHQEVAKVVLFAEPSDRLGLVQQQMAQTRQSYDRLKRLLADEEFGELPERMPDIEEWLSNGDSRE